MYPWARLHQDQIDKLCYKNNLDDVEIDLIEHIKVGFCKSIIDIFRLQENVRKKHHLLITVELIKIMESVLF